ncbi:MAG TPA: DUF1573 domain-containing protein, partial [Thermoanaerobaculia bacterium]|nr:DUF1573 domain-containing protein [Thermoanaerobaculia bacterium]
TSATTATQPISDTAAVDTGATMPVTPVPAPTPATPAASALRITPAIQDYGTIRKGTRAVRQFEVTNSGAEPLAINVARSQCKCLYYEYASTLTPKKKGTITVTIDGARAPAGDLRETLAVTSKKGNAALGQIEVMASIR